jgi:H+/Cl- antiporter ClcA
MGVDASQQLSHTPNLANVVDRFSEWFERRAARHLWFVMGAVLILYLANLLLGVLVLFMLRSLDCRNSPSAELRRSTESSPRLLLRCAAIWGMAMVIGLVIGGFISRFFPGEAGQLTRVMEQSFKLVLP